MSGGGRPWIAPARYVDARPVDPVQCVALHVDGEWVSGDLLLWLRGSDDTWWGYCHWWRGRTIYTEPIPAEHLRAVEQKNVRVYDDEAWHVGTLHGWRRHRGHPWEAAVRLPGWPKPAWVPRERVQPE